MVDTPDVNAPAVRTDIAALNALLDADPVFSQRSRIDNPTGDLALIQATFSVDAGSKAAGDAIERLRDDYIPAAFASGSATVLVGGDAAEIVDAVDVANTYLPIVIGFVLALSFLLLLLVFRSIVVPLKAVVMNLLSVGAAYGLLVLVFQQMGFGLAVAIILDATIVRLVLVPAAMELLGDRNWYFPSWLEWRPSIQIEGRVDDRARAPTPASGGD